LTITSRFIPAPPFEVREQSADQSEVEQKNCYAALGRVRSSQPACGFRIIEIPHAFRLPAWVYYLLPAEGVCLPDRGRHRPRGAVSGDDARAVRAQVRLPHHKSAAPADATRGAVRISAARWVLNPSGQADAVPHLSILAGAGREQKRVA